MKRFFEPLQSDILCKIKSNTESLPHYHRHDGCEIFIFLNGGATYYIEQHSYPLTSGSLLLINPEEYHRSDLLKNMPYDRIVINIRESFLEQLSTKTTCLSSCFLDRPCSEKNLIQLSNQDLQHFLVLSKQLSAALDSSAYGHDLLAISYLLQILIKTNTLYKSSLEFQTSPLDLMPPLVRDTMHYIEEHLTEPISLADLSATFYHNGTYISRYFKSITGLSISQYILYKRISLSQKLLKEGLPLTETCLMSGFNNYSNFSRTFAQQVGCSPKKYQNMFISKKPLS